MLRAESVGVLIKAGETMNLQHLALQNADPEEPRGLHVAQAVELSLECRQGVMETWQGWGEIR